MTAVDTSRWPGILEGEELAYLGEEPPRRARLAPLPDGLHPKVQAALAARGVTELYTHQATAWAAAARGEHLVVATGTASGKSLAFNLPVLSRAAGDPHARALYLYPTKALAQDQARALAELKLPGLRPAIYDGDTPTETRAQIRRQSNLILSNPDMLHVGVLPNHDRWADVLHNLAFVVVDEAHVYRGVFGSHVANVLRRLRRLALAYGANPQFLLASATIANPGELGAELVGVPFTVVEDDGAPRPPRTIALWNPPIVDPVLQTRASSLGEAARLLALLAGQGQRTLCFAKSRKAAELVHRFAADRLDAHTASRLSPYRAGYTAQQRRDIERRLVEGDLLGVTSTDALELGIDIGLLDAVITVGFPGTVASLRQQWGRAGRRGHGLAIMVASDDALDQFFLREPPTLLERRVEAAILDHANPRVLDPHVHAAAFEGPITVADAATLGPEALERAAVLPGLRETRAGWVWTGQEHPAARTPLRASGTDPFQVVDTETGAVLGLVERERAYTTVHEGAVYLHLGDTWIVQALDEEARVAAVRPFDGDWYTQAKKETMTSLVEPLRVERRAGLELAFGRVSVTEQVVAYLRKSRQTQGTVAQVPLDCPELSFDTEAIWFSPTDAQLDGLEEMPLLLASLHAAEHALIGMLPLWAMCDRWDVGGLSTNIHFQTGRPTIFIYDGHAGGMGLAERGFDVFEGWVEDTARLLRGCPCADGCPSCVQSPKCGNLNEHLSKEGALTLLARMANAPLERRPPAPAR